MKNSVSEADVIGLIRDQNKPMSIDGIASSLGVFRHLLNPVMRDMLTSGSLIRKEEGGVPLFFLSDTVLHQGDEAIEAASHHKMASNAGNVTPIAKSRQKAKAEGPKLTSISNPKAAQPDSVKDGSDSDKPNLKLLRMLLKPKALVSIKDIMGEVEPELEALKVKGIVDSDYILDEFVYYLTDKAKLLYPDLADSPSAPAPKTEDSVKSADSESKTVSQEPSATSDEDEVMAEAMRQLAKSSHKRLIKEAKAQIPVEETLSTKEIQVQVTEDHQEKTTLETDKATVKSPAKKASIKTSSKSAPAVEKPAAEAVSMASDTMSEVAQLVEKLVNQRLESHETSRLDTQTKEGLSSMLKEASDNLKLAAQALDKSLTLIEKL